MWKFVSLGALHAPYSCVGNALADVTVRKKFMRHRVPRAVPASTLKRPSGTCTAENHVSSSGQSVVAAVSPWATGSVT